ncbi:PLD nuclease N-terminal domain-containing protein [Psychromarinibacter sediminicola]
MGELSMFELSGIGGLILLALDIYALVQIFSSRASTGKKVLWSLGVIVFPLLGFIIWLLFGPRGAERHV